MEFDAKRARKTFQYDCLRGAFNGIIYTGFMTLAILVAKRHYAAPDWVKSMITSADSMGRMLTPLMLWAGLKWAIPTNVIARNYMILLAGLLVGAALAPSVWFYAASVVFAYIVFAQPPQLMVHIYANNYEDANRGTKVALMYVLSTTVGVCTSYGFGKWLDVDFGNFRYEYMAMAVCCLVCAYALKRIPSKVLIRRDSGNVLENIGLIFKDGLFGWLVLGYFLLGFANSMVIPIRIEYMADAEKGLNASNLLITTMVVIVPGLSMIVATRLWGWVFDKFHFITTRLLVNACFIIALLTFFKTDNVWVLGFSSMMNGFAIAGGMIVWHLWVTKVAPEGCAAKYMSAHVFASGVKGLVGPATGYALYNIYGAQKLGIIAASVMVITCVMFAAVWKNKRIR